MDTANTWQDLALSKPALRIFNVLVFALTLAAVVTLHVLWYRGLLDLGTQLKWTGAALAIAAGAIVAEGIINSHERRDQRGFRVILKEKRSDE